MGSVELTEKVLHVIRADPEKARDLATRFDLNPNDLNLSVLFFAAVVCEFQDMALGNPFDVTTRPFTRMTGVPGFVENVRRFVAGPAALARARARSTPLTGQLERGFAIAAPMLAPG